jgi:hypothetical protein
MFFKVARYNLPVYNGYCKIEVPIGSDALGVVADTVSADPGKTPLFVFINQPIAKEGEEEEVETEELEFLVVGDGSPYGNPDKEETLLYLGKTIWDNGYRINHVFLVVDEEAYGESLGLDYSVSPEVDKFIDQLENPPPEHEPEE